MIQPTGSFEPWLLRRVAQAVEAGDVPATLLTELQAEFEVARATPQDLSHAAAVRQISQITAVDQEKAAEALAAIEGQPEVTRELLMRRIAEAWLQEQRRSHPAD